MNVQKQFKRVSAWFRNERGDRDEDVHTIAGSDADIIKDVRSRYAGMRDKLTSIEIDGRMVWHRWRPIAHGDEQTERNVT